MHLLLDVQGRDVDRQVGQVLLVLAPPDQLGVQVAVAALVGHGEGRRLFLPHQGLVLRGGDVGAGVLLVAQGFNLLAGGGAGAAWSGHGGFLPYYWFRNGLTIVRRRTCWPSCKSSL